MSDSTVLAEVADIVDDVSDIASGAATQVFSWWEWTAKTLAYIQSAFVSIVFFMLFLALVIWIIKLNVGNGEYKNFRIADMIRRADGTIDRKATERAGLFLSTTYGFLYVVHKHPEIIIGYLAVMAGIWLGYQVADNKLPNRGKPPETTPDPNAPAPPLAPPPLPPATP